MRGRERSRESRMVGKGDTGAVRGREIQTLYLHTITN
jgi:hypothetical protein